MFNGWQISAAEFSASFSNMFGDVLPEGTQPGEGEAGTVNGEWHGDDRKLGYADGQKVMQCISTTTISHCHALFHTRVAQAAVKFAQNPSYIFKWIAT